MQATFPSIKTQARIILLPRLHILKHILLLAEQRVRYSPREGRMVLFPSYLPHEVLPSQIEQEKSIVIF